MQTYVFSNGTGGVHVIMAVNKEAAWKKLEKYVVKARLTEWELSGAKG